MKNQALFSLKDKSKKLKWRMLQFLFGTLRVNAKWDANMDNDTNNWMTASAFPVDVIKVS